MEKKIKLFKSFAKLIDYLSDYMYRGNIENTMHCILKNCNRKENTIKINILGFELIILKDIFLIY